MVLLFITGHKNLCELIVNRQSLPYRPSCLEEGATSGALSEQLWRRATASGAFTVFEKRAFGIADDMYCLYFLCSSFSKLQVLLDKDIAHILLFTDMKPVFSLHTWPLFRSVKQA